MKKYPKMIRRKLKMNEKVKNYLKAVFYVVWILVSILIWSIFLSVFLNDKTFGMWMAWGFACTLVMIPTAAKFIWECAKEGYKDGTHSYTGNLFASVYGGIGISIRDRRYSQAIVTLIMSIIVFLLIGPVLLPIKIVFSVLELIPLIRVICVDKAFAIKALKITGIVALVLIVILIISSIFKSCSTLNNNYEIFGEETSNGYLLEVRRSGGKSTLDNDKFIWSVSDENVAYITSDGVLTFNRGGYVVVRATSAEDTKDYIEKSFFRPYDVVADSGEAVVSKLNTSDEEDFWIGLAKTIAEDAYSILCATRQDKIMDVMDELLDFFVTFDDDDAYLFSTALGKYHVENEELYVLCNWTSSDVDVTNKIITDEQLSKIVCKPYNPNYQDGDSIHNFGVNTINSFISSEIPADGIYRFSQMDDQYEYRVVLRGDFDYGTSTHYYRHGLLSGLLNAIKNMSWEDVSNMTETRYYNEISNLSNLRICIEYREK